MRDVGLMKLDINSGKIEALISDGNISWDSRVAVHKGRICFTCPQSSAVTVLDSEYKLLYKLKDETLLKYPTGVAFNERMNVFILGHHSKNLVLISPDGKTSKELLTEADGLKEPFNVNYNSNTKKLIMVECGSGEVTTYSLE